MKKIKTKKASCDSGSFKLDGRGESGENNKNDGN
jgi:hypothetical protein